VRIDYLSLLNLENVLRLSLCKIQRSMACKSVCITVVRRRILAVHNADPQVRKITDKSAVHRRGGKYGETHLSAAIASSLYLKSADGVTVSDAPIGFVAPTGPIIQTLES
jgi:hypothetical protein